MNDRIPSAFILSQLLLPRHGATLARHGASCAAVQGLGWLAWRASTEYTGFAPPCDFSLRHPSPPSTAMRGDRAPPLCAVALRVPSPQCAAAVCGHLSPRAQPYADVQHGLVSIGNAPTLCMALCHRCALPCVADLRRPAPLICSTASCWPASLLLCSGVRRPTPLLFN